MKKFYRIFLLILLIVFEIFSTCRGYSEQMEREEIFSPYAAVEEGIVEVQGNVETENYRSTEIEILEFWHYTPEQKDYRLIVHQIREEGSLTAVVVPETPYQLIFLDGSPQPFLLDTERWKLWYLDGLGRYFGKARLIIPGDRCITLCTVENLNNYDLIWKFDFSDPESGFIINYDYIGIW
ncbi:MAG: hypothetical protein APR63_02945 [Desulfuromonas sp. SDB]|nr:MAG: hypothetical protein APR63_02945 [Desulfuromonas sp. SDB]